MEGSNPVNRDKAILGIHIDDDCLDIVHLGQTANGLKVLNWTSEPLEAGIVKDGLITDVQIVSQKICNFIKAGQIKSDKAVMSLPCSTLRLKPCEFPARKDKQLQQQVEEQIDKYAFFGGREVTFDYCIFEGKAQASNKQIVLQAITTRQISDTHLTVAKRAGLKLMRIEPALLSIIKLDFDKQSEDPQGVLLLLVPESASVNLSVFKDGLPQLCQNLSIDIKDLSQGKDDFSHLTEQGKSILDFAHSLAGSQPITLKVASACNSEKLDTIVGQIKQRISDVKIEQIDHSLLSRQFDVQGIEKEVPFFALSTALSAFEVCEYNGKLNLISQQSLIMQKAQKEISLTAKVIVAVVLLSFATLIPLKMKIKSVEAISTEIQAKVTETIPMRDKINDLTKQVEQLSNKSSVYRTDITELTNIPWPKALSIIGDAVPDNVRIVDISTADSGDFMLMGEALAETYVYKFAKKLQDEKLIEHANVEEIEYDNKDVTIIVDYKISCTIRLPDNDL
jgi:Tfp pilus assembly PilM family ATPase